MRIERLEGPALEPISLAEMGGYLRLDLTDDDFTVASAIRSARELCEAFTGTILIATQFRQHFPVASGQLISLSKTPVRSVAGVQIIAADGGEIPLSPDAYAFEISPFGDATLTVSSTTLGRDYQVDYWAGLTADWNGVPEPLRQGILRLAAHFYAHRDRPDDLGPPAAVAALWRPYRRARLI